MNKNKKNIGERRNDGKSDVVDERRRRWDMKCLIRWPFIDGAVWGGRRDDKSYVMIRHVFYARAL